MGALSAQFFYLASISISLGKVKALTIQYLYLASILILIENPKPKLQYYKVFFYLCNLKYEMYK